MARGNLIPWLAVAATVLVVAYRHGSAPAPVVCERDVVPDAVQVVMLATSWCPYCREARQWFDDHAVAYCEYDIEHTARGQALYDEHGSPGFPVMLKGDQSMLGFDPERLAAFISIR